MAAGGLLPPGPRPPETPTRTLSEGCSLSFHRRKIVKTFNNGSLGSGIDEERSEMRYVM